MGQGTTESRSDFGSQSIAMMALKGQSTPSLLSPDSEGKLLKNKRLDSNAAAGPALDGLGYCRIGKLHNLLGGSS